MSQVHSLILIFRTHRDILYLQVQGGQTAIYRNAYSNYNIKLRKQLSGGGEDPGSVFCDKEPKEIHQGTLKEIHQGTLQIHVKSHRG